ncbi:unnamed protein product [Parascedosporium putredinis]|uniref:NADP-dependent oxidoreductase domain-containing protein n=1 Tax=Parascedosporium putredinis TaxID=1442378 RepID=A0A9P1M754_9PEZI|nr:unnamed protein product [Parascedosporium putredinis]CAI7990998.1 unnamed protein product [Parascedosporium putredinis]
MSFAIKATLNSGAEIPYENQEDVAKGLEKAFREVPGLKREDIFIALGNNTVGKPLLIEHATIIKIAEEVGGSPAQVLLAWAQFGGHSVIPKSVTPSRIHANFKEVKLSSEHVAAINKIGEAPHRYNIPVNFNPKWDIAIWNEEDEQNATYQVIERIS